jgi:hypothetical protein
MDMSNVDFDNPENMEPELITWLGPFSKVEGDWAKDYFDSILDDAEGPTPGHKSIIFNRGQELRKKKNREKKKRKRR